MQLKMIFPGANSSLLAMRQPELVLGFDMVGAMAGCGCGRLAGRLLSFAAAAGQGGAPEPLWCPRGMLSEQHLLLATSKTPVTCAAAVRVAGTAGGHCCGAAGAAAQPQCWCAARAAWCWGAVGDG